jgi:uncharacterized protein (TIGR00297 family)
VLGRALTGAVLCALFVVSANRLRTLSISGAIAAAIVGTLSIAAGWSWGIVLLAFFASASALSKVGERRKTDLTGSIVEKGGARDAIQVLANGGIYAAAALGEVVFPSSIWFAIGAGALAASCSDTWATEIGTLAGGDPISIISGKTVPAGTSGGITFAGTIAAIAGALFIAVVAALASWPVPFTAITVGGIVGALTDSVLGGSVQARRWCDLCAVSTERVVHGCGTKTRPAGGIAGLDNDSVNTICSAIGALVALLLS